MVQIIFGTGSLAALRPNATDSTELRALAAECYVTGGPSIFAARAYWNVVYQKNDNSFQDYCFETTGYYKTDSIANKENSLELFKVYPTVLERGSFLNINATEPGIIKLMDISGKILIQSEFKKGVNKLQLFELASSQLLLYDAVIISGNKYNGKIFVK
ncbi:MAG: hypothetical protein KF706_02690 [Chitinophagales bacterium]|nr:hypothetical protein [Chitinophagales bacterium]